MSEYRSVEATISKSLGLKKRPVAVIFVEAPPIGVSKFEGAQPSGCSFWRIAASGKTFYTVPSDHYNCAVGSHTHNIPLPPERTKDLEQTLSFSDASRLRLEVAAPIVSKFPGGGNDDTREVSHWRRRLSRVHPRRAPDLFPAPLHTVRRQPDPYKLDCRRIRNW